MSVTTKNFSINKKHLMCWVIIFIIPLLLLLIPTTDLFTHQQKMFTVITTWTILMFAFELVDNYIPCIIMPFLFIITGVAPMGVGFCRLASIDSLAGAWHIIIS